MTSIIDDDAVAEDLDQTGFDEEEEEESEEARDARKAEEQKGAEKKAEKEKHPFVKRYLDEERNFDSSDSSDHPCPQSGKEKNKANKKLPRRCDWPNVSGTDTERGFLHEARNKSRSRSSSYGDGKRIPKEPRKREEWKRKNKRQRSPSEMSAPRRDDTRPHKAKEERKSSPLETSAKKRRRSRSKRPRIKLMESGSSGSKGKEKGKLKGKSKDPDKGKRKKSRADSRGHSKGNLKCKSKPAHIDDDNKFSCVTTDRLESLCNEVGQDDIADGNWKQILRLTDEDDDKGRTDFCEGAFQYLEDIGKTIYNRIHIGSG